MEDPNLPEQNYRHAAAFPFGSFAPRALNNASTSFQGMFALTGWAKSASRVRWCERFMSIWY